MNDRQEMVLPRTPCRDRTVASRNDVRLEACYFAERDRDASHPTEVGVPCHSSNGVGQAERVSTRPALGGPKVKQAISTPLALSAGPIRP